MRAVRESLREMLAARRPAPATRAAKPPRRPTPKPKKAAAQVTKKIREREAPASRARPRSLEQIEQALLRHLRGGVLLMIDDARSLGSSDEAPLVHAAIERLVAQGLVGVTGEGSDRFVFATRGRPAASPRRRSAPPRATPATTATTATTATNMRRQSTPAPAAPAAAKKPATEPPPAPQTSAPEAAPAPAPSGPPAGHPFVVRRKKSA
ncbi:MAG: hypothetical protein HYV09_38635 [Deltaproteobacteria bacterium]|nr:hypothetical protein [Deltaproteobacteria bacterium]